jgi:hypothetical protein
MLYRRIWIAVIVVILGLVMFIQVAQAQRQEWEGVFCSAQTQSAVHLSLGEIYIGSFDQKGIFQSTHEKKLFDNWTAHAVGVGKWEGGKTSWNGFSKNMGPDGDIIIWEFYGDSESGTTVKAIYGSGKWKGVKGEGKVKGFTTGKPIVQSTNQFCEKQAGWVELPK